MKFLTFPLLLAYFSATSQVVVLSQQSNEIVYYADTSEYDSIFVRVQNISDVSEYYDVDVSSDTFNIQTTYCNTRHWIWLYENGIVSKVHFDYNGYYIKLSVLPGRKVRIITDVECKVTFSYIYVFNPYMTFFGWSQGTEQILPPGDHIVFLPYIIKGVQFANFQINGCEPYNVIFYLW